jgi:copper chaperone CopZ
MNMNKNFILPLVIIVVVGGIGGVLLLNSSIGDNLRSGTNIQQLVQTNLRKVNLSIENMFCIGCRASLIGGVTAIPGVIQADAEPKTDSGWVVYDPEQISKEQLVANSIFAAYPAEITSDEVYSGTRGHSVVTEIPVEIQQKLNILAQALQDREVELESFFQKELDDTLEQGFWDKANNLLDNYIKAYTDENVNATATSTQ